MVIVIIQESKTFIWDGKQQNIHACWLCFSLWNA